MTVFYFTATGNSLYVAKEIGGGLEAASANGSLVSIPQALKNRDFVCEDEVIGIVFPCYGFDMPGIVKEFLSNVSWNAQYTFAVMTYGSMSAAALRHLDRFANENDIHFDYIEKILMVDNYLPNFEMEDQLKSVGGKQIDRHLAEIVSSIAARKQYQPKSSAMDRIFSSAVRTSGMFNMFRQGDFSKKNYTISDTCNQCGICARVCPTKNVAVAENVRFENRCESCMACVHLCPQNAIHLKSEKSDVRFKNEHVSLKEIIAANNQGV